MTNLLRPVMGLLLAVPSLFAQSQGETKSNPYGNYRSVAQRVDALLRRENGTRLEIEGERIDNVASFRKETNRILFTSNKADHRLVNVVIEPIEEEGPGTAVLTGALLVSLSAVDNIEDGIRVAGMVTAENDKDGRPRSITLNHGIKLLRFKSDCPKPRFEINL